MVRIVHEMRHGLGLKRQVQESPFDFANGRGSQTGGIERL